MSADFGGARPRSAGLMSRGSQVHNRAIAASSPAPANADGAERCRSLFLPRRAARLGGGAGRVAARLVYAKQNTDQSRATDFETTCVVVRRASRVDRRAVRRVANPYSRKCDASNASSAFRGKDIHKAIPLRLVITFVMRSS